MRACGTLERVNSEKAPGWNIKWTHDLRQDGPALCVADPVATTGELVSFLVDYSRDLPYP